MKAVIMAGGFGTRIHPLTINMPKPMIPLFNRPMMLHIVELLKKHGINELILLLYHQPEVIKNYFGDGSEFGVRITYVTPLEDFGTAGAVKQAAKYLKERFVIISGDLLTDFDISAAIRFHEEQQAEASIVLTSVKDPLQFGVVITDKNGRITKFLEKPGWGEVFSDTINTGIYVLEPGVLERIPDNENRDWSKDVFPAMLAENAALFGCNLQGYWQDVGNTDAYLEACRDVFAGKVAVNLPGTRAAADGKHLQLGQDVLVEQKDLSLLEGMVLIGDNTHIKGKARLKNCVIGRNCTIEDGVELEDTILWRNVYVRKGSRIKGATLCNSVQIGQGVVIEEGAVIADETTVGDEAFIKKDVKIWPRKVVEGGAIVTTNLIWGEKWRKSLFDGALVRGLTNVELTPEFSAKLGSAFGSTLPKGSVVLCGRDAVRSSRMLKRAFVGGLLSTGVNVIDVKMISLPVLRYKLTTFGEVGGVHFRQCPDDPAATEIIFYDADGVEISSSAAKGIERVYYKENFRRVHHSEPGGISELPRIYDYYREGYRRALDREALRAFAPKVVVDLNHSPAGDLLPSLLNELGCEVIELNSHVSEIASGATPEQRERAKDQLSRIVVTLGAAAGFWIGPSGERCVLIDERGEIFSDIDALCTLAALVCRAEGRGELVAPVPAPQAIEDLAQASGLTVTRTKNDGRALVEAAKNKHVQLGFSMEGHYIFPAFHSNFDAMFTVAKTLELLARTGQPLSAARQAVTRRAYRHIRIPCSFDLKGGIMRKMSEDSVDHEASFIDGVKVQLDDAWVLMLPDQHQPIAHLIAESDNAALAERLVEEYRNKLEAWKKELLSQ
ncbi:mannose-1-phosphate guanyltransferase [Geoalkalibacter halelectricus]|uniref:Mannose-1-phosphate guanyltransferase n=1 Tax=Geoalkalibacter halelectricus TaxID=2847045 RepID=A0ABY5ZQ87_9BACT|nr:mannose-1-phosphate guanyltransferase [Geoalkalibacter halelectricus]MDO3377588.1 mannose-1-phosphate guanyltransferase [Geoalkalibacter halelectricus]UWZ80654.1 mannose-1-phosphate guanyltransferase [Geoalkalibacter halelectricus]